MYRILFATGFCFLLATACSANNNYFIPGDAFFYFEIDQTEWKTLKSGELATVDYDRPEGSTFTLGGYAGYKTLDISSLPDQFRDQLVQAIALMKEKYPTKIIEIDHGKPKFFGDPAGIEKKETNKIRIFAYNNVALDFPQFRIGLKYNESWPETAVDMGLNRKNFFYDFFIPTPRGITESWRWGSAVAPLSVQLADSERGYVTTPIKIDPSQVTFLVCPPTSLESLCFPTRDESIECFAVSQNGRVKLTNDTSSARKSVWLQSK